MPLRSLLVLLCLMLLAAPRPAAAYAVLTHQANVDSCWAPCLRPALAKRFPGGTNEEWVDAKAYAYGGAIIQDMGYYPFGSKLFTDLTHYVRSGSFVRNLLDEAHTREEYAFALGAMAHYAADIKGHGEGTNKVVPLLFPELKAKYGPVVTYEQDPVAHARAEFAFDVTQMAAGRYRTDTYHDFIGFKVQKEVLERAFLKTYGLPLSSVIFNVDLSIASYRFAVRQLIPVVSRAAWRANRHEIRRMVPGAHKREYVYKESAAAYRRKYGTGYEHPKFGARLLAGIIRILPKVGSLRSLKFITPTPAAQAIYRASFRGTVREYCTLLDAQEQGRAPLPDFDFDTGKATKLGEYGMADETYGQWLRRLAKDDFKDLTPAVRQNILSFFDGKRQTPIAEEERKKDNMEETQTALKALRTRNP